MSPLRSEVRQLLAVKQGIGYSGGCNRCMNQSAYDDRIRQAVEAKDDPGPYLAETRKELLALRESNAALLKKLEDARKWQQPITRLRLGIYTAAGSGLVMAGFTVARWLLGLP